ncbi:MAG: hypothetical protein GY941_04020 [Planctomycetes bacterium]|nr:hypothetical protein [Planctomycetota bacterium]
MVELEITYSNGTITSEDLIKYLATSGHGAKIYPEIIKNKEVVKKAAESGIKISDEELQRFADNFRTTHRLYNIDEMRMFLENSGLTEDDFELFCECVVLTETIKDHLATEDRIQDHFVNNRSEFDQARISIIIVKEEVLANEIMMQVTEEDEDFHKLARQHSRDEVTRYSGGYIGVISRSTLSPGVAAKVFNAPSGDLIGPFQQDGSFQLILVEEVIRAELNEYVRDNIKERIFSEWVSQFLKGGIKINR